MFIPLCCPNRGPVPLFWSFRNGDKTTGVTIHELDKGWTVGDPRTTSNHYSLWQQLCRPRSAVCYLGGTLLAQTVWDMYQGKATRQPQDEAASSYYSFPTEQDFIVPVHEWGQIVSLTLSVASAIGSSHPTPHRPRNGVRARCCFI